MWNETHTTHQYISSKAKLRNTHTLAVNIAQCQSRLEYLQLYYKLCKHSQAYLAPTANTTVKSARKFAKKDIAVSHFTMTEKMTNSERHYTDSFVINHFIFTNNSAIFSHHNEGT